MALSVTTTTAVASNADTLTINKPASVQTGDTLVIIANGEYNGSSAAVSGFTQILTSIVGSPHATLSMLYRIADASDVSASNYTITLGGAQTLGAAAMLRVRGLGTGNPLFASATATAIEDSAGYTLSSSTLSLARPNEQLLIMAGQFNGDEDPGSFSGYTVTSSDANPTWTEVLDSSYAINSQPADEAMFVAYAITTNTSTITQYSVGVSASTSGTSDAVATFLAVMVEPLNATASNALFQTTPDYFSPLTGSTQEPNSDFQEIEPEFFTQSARAINPTQWTNESKPSTTWTNEQK